MNFILRLVIPSARAIVMIIVFLVMWTLFTTANFDIARADSTASPVDSATAHTPHGTSITCTFDDKMLWWTGDTSWADIDQDGVFETYFKHRCAWGHVWYLTADEMAERPWKKSAVAIA